MRHRIPFNYQNYIADWYDNPFYYGFGMSFWRGSSANDIFFLDINRYSFSSTMGKAYVNGGDGSDAVYLTGGHHTDPNNADTTNEEFSGYWFDLSTGVGRAMFYDERDGEYSRDRFVFNSIESIYSTDFDDFINGNDANNILVARGGDDTVSGAEGDDYINLGRGNDTAFGGSENDTIIGGPGEDKLFGEAGNDVLIGGRHGDELRGGSGDDTLFGGGGPDTLFGGSGGDTFIFGLLDTSPLSLSSSGDATSIGDFDPTEDEIWIPAGLTYGGRTANPDFGEYTVWQSDEFTGIAWNSGGLNDEIRNLQIDDVRLIYDPETGGVSRARLNIEDIEASIFTVVDHTFTNGWEVA